MVMAVNSSVTFASHTVATPTDAIQRENQQRPIFTQVSQAEAYHRERGIGAGAERAPIAESFANQLGKARKDTERSRAEHTGKEEKSATGEILSKSDQEKVQQLKERDAEVRRHEQAHATLGGQYAGSPQYEMEQGPDGRSYAVGGEVSIDVAPIANDPAATIQKMQTVRRAALGVDEPSPADRSIANKATEEEQKARQKLAEERQEELKNASSEGVGPEKNNPESTSSAVQPDQAGLANEKLEKVGSRVEETYVHSYRDRLVSHDLYV